MATPQEILENQINISELFHIYGELLSNRQRNFIRLYYDDNLSLSEIAAQHEISRQAVHDAIKHGRKALTRYEETLHLRDIKKTQGTSAGNPDWNSKLEMILEEMEKAIHEEAADIRGRLLAQIAPIRDLIRVSQRQ